MRAGTTDDFSATKASYEAKSFTGAACATVTRPVFSGVRVMTYCELESSFVGIMANYIGVHMDHDQATFLSVCELEVITAPGNSMCVQTTYYPGSIWSLGIYIDHSDCVLNTK